MQHARFHFTEATEATLGFTPLLPVKAVLEKFFAAKKLPVDIAILDRQENYPVVFIEPKGKTTLENIKGTLTEANCTCTSGIVRLQKIMVTIDPDNGHAGAIILQAGQSIVTCLAEQIAEKHGLSLKPVAPKP